MRRSILVTGSLILCFVLFLHPASTRAQEVEDEREFDYAEGSEKGPRRWGELKKEWAACSNGDMQSPIDMSHERVKIITTHHHEMRKHYKPANATVRNRGHDIAIEWHGDAGSVIINGTDYFLKSAHWHSPSEHTINGRRYALELHMVHQNTDQNLTNQIAVIGVLYKIGKPDAFLSKLMRNISSMIDRDVEKELGMFDPSDIKMRSKRHYRYMGSLTVPPCTEGVIWTINKKVRTASRKQIKLLREAVHDYAERNARPLQALNRREIYLLSPAGKKLEK
ncbi:PREDICTED: alpha carbonic anhydrase 7-like [Ipomoea nil]|uniref:alpha carbonic anhydrase 7-like n=1 Tax=Ipomoea nil TaxID=35883 RepID=UPI000900956C|nr:PREDICTED: alpha carbonic anhydrase 7-like [Ipomoea nil]